jgi:nucleolar GTP-binding protein
MYKIPPILTPDELIDKAFKRANKVQVTARDKATKNKKMAIAKVRKAANTLSSTLNKFIKSFPSFDSIPIFYYELFDVTIGIDDLKKSLGAVEWSRKTIKSIADKTVDNISHSRDKTYIKSQFNAAYGRFSSVLKQIEKDLVFLNTARNKLRSIPAIDSQKPTIVFAGAPNVGKSLLVAKISSAKPKIASYPFTTKGISIGHIEDHGIIYQVIDTPGLLDREMEERNEMEKKAILALRHLANIIVFIMDPSEHCGYEVDIQMRILSDIKSRFCDIPVIEVENKSDILKSDSPRQKISALQGDGVSELRNTILFNLRNKND